MVRAAVQHIKSSQSSGHVPHVVKPLPFVATKRPLKPHSRCSSLQTLHATSAGGASASTLVQQIIRSTAGTNVSTAPQDVSSLVDSLLALNQCPQADATLRSGKGTWQVCYAPHIRGLASVLVATIEPVEYRLAGDVITTNVKLVNPLGTVWLSARATVAAAGSSVALQFDRYWADFGEDALRSEAPAQNTALDSLIALIGKAAFFIDSTEYPLKYFDSRLVIFKFPLLNTTIAAKRV